MRYSLPVFTCLVGLALLAAACSGAAPTAAPVQPRASVAPASAAGTVPAPAGSPLPTLLATLPAGPAPAPSQTPLGSPGLAAPLAPGAAPAVSPAANCAGPEANRLGASIAGDYAFTTPEQVMGWFCEGAEFEDILVALETAEQTGASADELLAMVSAGMTWEEIWQTIGLEDE